MAPSHTKVYAYFVGTGVLDCPSETGVLDCPQRYKCNAENK